MKKIIIGGIATIAIVAAMALNVNFNAKNDNLSDIFLSNVEALAGNEGGVPDPNGCSQFLFGASMVWTCQCSYMNNTSCGHWGC